MTRARIYWGRLRVSAYFGNRHCGAFWGGVLQIKGLIWNSWMIRAHEAFLILAGCILRAPCRMIRRNGGNGEEHGEHHRSQGATGGRGTGMQNGSYSILWGLGFRA